jgi:two-component system chemotaxis sensor kinase CheA
MSIDLSQFYQIFFEETAEHLAAMETLLLALDVSDPSMDDLNAIFRAAHSIKGGAGTFGFTDMASVTHVLETLLDRLRKQEMILTHEMVSAFLAAGDVISTQLAAHRGEGEVDEAEVAEVCARLARLTAGGGAPPENHPPPAQAAAPAAAQPAADDDAYGFFGDEPAETARAETAEQGYGFFDDISEGSALSQEAGGQAKPEAERGYGFFDDTPEPAAKPVQGDNQVKREAEQGYGFFQELPPAPKAAAPVAAPAAKAAEAPVARRASDKAAAVQADSSIRVSVEKVDQLINLAGELVITQAMLAQSAIEAVSDGNERLQRGLYQLERNTRDLQEAVMSIRMMPISFVFSRFPRLVRDLSAKLSKQVEMKMIGENTELDKGLIEKISDPMTHLVRNSLDHGIELPEVRSAAGKNPQGTVTLKAYHQGGNVVIEVADDGRGLSRGRILAKAQERGLPVKDEMTDQEVWALIMEPGFSTAEVVTDVSGRGVGMDVVKRNITELGGRVELDSAEGFGSRVIIRLPLTLAILDGLSVSVGGEIYIIPLNAIVESLQMKPSDLKTVSGEGRVVQVRSEYLPLVALHEVFNTRSLAGSLENGIVVIVEAEGKKTALFVDSLLGQHQVVIKSLESNFRKVQGVSGATIMGDGRVALILDVGAMIAYSGNRAKERVASL